jgi:hypothetical protein
MTYQISSLFFPLFFACFLFSQLSVFMIHSVASWEKTQLLNQRLNSMRLLLSPGVPVWLSWARDHCTQKTVRRTVQTIYKGLRGACPSCVSSFCHGNTDYWICLDVVCLSSRNHGLFELYLGSLCWKNERASLIHAVEKESNQKVISIVNYRTWIQELSKLEICRWELLYSPVTFPQGK